jgi:hypothetical protein
VAERRQAWFDSQPDLDPDQLVFIDETGASTKMARLRGRAKRGERCRAAVPHGHVWTPRAVQGKTLDCDGACRVLACVRPLLRLITCRGPVWDPWVRSKSLERARSASRVPGLPDPVSPTLRHTCPTFSSRRRQPRVRSWLQAARAVGAR